MRTRALLLFLLGLWLGGALAIDAAATYNFAGLEHQLARNDRLAERAGFDPADSAAKKTSLLWVHASELNRTYFSAWNRTQLVLGALAIALAPIARVGWRPAGLLVLALVLTALMHFGIEPQVDALGRSLDFVPRDPPPPGLSSFQRLHGLSSAAELARLALLALAVTLLVLGPREADRAHPKPADPR